jgi:DNA-binding NtrC family response regulator
MARILLIDDDDAVRTMVSLALDRNGHTVIEACNGEEGLALFPRVKADLLITDLVMPGKGGLAVLAEVRGRSPPVKAIAMSGGGRWGPWDDLEEARNLGAARVLAKPFSLDTLIAAVDELLASGAPISRDIAR